MIWTRLLSLLFGATVYTFSLILAVFLFGLGIGSSLGSAIGRSTDAPARRARLVSDAAVRRDRVGGLHADGVAAVLADQPVDHRPMPGSTSSSISSAASGSCCPAPILWGASFPLALAVGRIARPGSRRGWSAASTRRTRSARSSARCAPACCSSSWLGSQHAAAGADRRLGALRPARAVDRSRSSDGRRRRRFQLAGTLGDHRRRGGRRGAARRATCIPLPGIFVAYGRYTATRLGQADIIYMGEGWNASVAVSRSRAAC